jgi:aconitate hydratase
MGKKALNSFKTKSELKIEDKTYTIFNLKNLEKTGHKISHLPFSLKILLENLLRNEDGETVTKDDVDILINWDPKKKSEREISFMPARVLLQDFTGVPALVDLAVMRDAMAKLGSDPKKINPLLPCELVIDHSLQVDSFASRDSFKINKDLEYERNHERYKFLKWGQESFDNFKVVPPATGICHQVNLEYLGRVIFTKESDGELLAYPDTLVGTDSHTTMINGLGILGWGVGGIEAEACMLGEPTGLLIPEVIGFRLHGKLPKNSTATDLVLTVTKMLRKKSVVGKFVEFFGEGIPTLSVADRATLSNMCPEYGATCAIFPIDEETVKYLELTGRDKKQIELIEAYTKATGLFGSDLTTKDSYTDILELDLGTVKPCMAGPKKPHEQINLSDIKNNFIDSLPSMASPISQPTDVNHWGTEGGRLLTESKIHMNCHTDHHCRVQHGTVVISAITSCTNTSNPSVMIGAGLLARNAALKGMKKKPWVKTSLAPGSKVVTDYLDESGLTPYLEKLGFHLVGYGCTTCIGNSGPLCEQVAETIEENKLVACSVLSGNRNFEGRIHPQSRANYLASPLLVVAYALAGQVDIDLIREPLGKDKSGKDVYLMDIWPSPDEVATYCEKYVKTSMFSKEYSEVFKGGDRWRALETPKSDRYNWDDKSTYIKAPTFFDGITKTPEPLIEIKGAKVLALLGDTITTDHISPAGSIKEISPAGRYLIERGIEKKDFNQYGARRGNHEVMIRGTFANIRLKNLMLNNVEGGFTLHPSSRDPMSIFNAAEEYRKEGTPLIVIAGKEYGSGSSRDWAAKGTMLLGVKAVIAESFERIHRSNLIGMGVLPLQFDYWENWQKLGLTGYETYDILGLSDELKPEQKLTVKAVDKKGTEKIFSVIARVDTKKEVNYLRHGGILHYVLRNLS